MSLGQMKGKTTLCSHCTSHNPHFVGLVSSSRFVGKAIDVIISVFCNSNIFVWHFNIWVFSMKSLYSVAILNAAWKKFDNVYNYLLYISQNKSYLIIIYFSMLKCQKRHITHVMFSSPSSPVTCDDDCVCG